MARNQNPALKVRHTYYVATTGGGKSQALKQNPEIPKRGARCVLWDPDRDHWAFHCTSLPQFRRVLIKALLSGKGFRIAYAGPDTEAVFVEWCRDIWKILDGRFITYVIIEELASVVKSHGKAEPALGNIMKRGRKYGAQVHTVFQRLAEIPKTVSSQSQVRYIGIADTEDIDRMAKLSGESVDAIEALEELQFYRKEKGPKPAQLLKISYKK